MHDGKTDRRCEGVSDILDPTFAQDKAEKSSINKSLTSSKQGSEKRDLQEEPNYVHDRIGNESDCSNR